jgi:hypothetical protein
MPVYLRNFYMKEFGELKKQEAESIKNASTKR